jgi:hypothetical protein
MLTDTTLRTKACPMCGEQVLMAARKCKHCQEYLNGKSKTSGSGYEWTGGRIALLVIGLVGLAFLFWFFAANGGILRSLF